MKTLVSLICLLSCANSFAATQKASRCVIQNLATRANSGQVAMVDVNTYEDPLMNTQEASFQNIRVVFTNGMRRLDLLKDGNQIASVRVPMMKSGDLVTLSGTETDEAGRKMEYEASCKLIIKGLPK